MAEEQNDREAVEAFIKQQVEQYVKEYTPQQQQHTDPAKDQQQMVRELIAPIVEPDIHQARMIAADAKDEVRFYRANPDALDLSEQIEELFDKGMKAGRPTTRQDLYDYLIGRTYRTEPDKFNARREAQLKKAEAASDFGAGVGKEKAAEASLDNFKSLSLEDMEKALEGVTF